MYRCTKEKLFHLNVGKVIVVDRIVTWTGCYGMGSSISSLEYLPLDPLFDG